jgi:hypothetical protein
MKSLSNSNNILNKNRKNNPKIHIKPQETSTSQSNLKQQEQSGRNLLPGFKLYYKLMEFKAAWCWQKNGHCDA